MTTVFKRLFLKPHISKKHYILVYTQVGWGGGGSGSGAGGGWGGGGVCVCGGGVLSFDNFSLKTL